LRALAVSPLSVTVPLLSLTPAFTALLAVPMLGERPGLLQTVGILAVVTGAFLITLQQGDSPSVVLAAFRRERGAMLMAGVAFLWSIALPLDKLAIQQAPAPFHAAMLNGGVAALVLLRLAAVGRVGELRGLRHVGPAF